MKSVQAPDLRLAIACVLEALTFSLSCFFGTRFATGPTKRLGERCEFVRRVL